MSKKFWQLGNSASQKPQLCRPQVLASKKLVSNVAFATKSKIKSPLTRSSVSGSHPVTLSPTPLMGEVSSYVQTQGRQTSPHNLAGRNPVLEQTVSLKPRETLVKAVPTTGIPIKAVPIRTPEKSWPYRQAIAAKAPPEAPVLIPIERRKWRHIRCMRSTSGESKNLREWCKY